MQSTKNFVWIVWTLTVFVCGLRNVGATVDDEPRTSPKSTSKPDAPKSDLLETELRALLEKIRSRKKEERQEAYRRLQVLGEGAWALLEPFLRTRVEELQKKLRGMDDGAKLERIARYKRLFDQRRQRALELIFDEVKYFYPYQAAIVGGEKYKEYLEVQKEVEARVAAVREIWDSRGTLEVRLTHTFKDLLDEVREIDEQLRLMKRPGVDLGDQAYLLHLLLDAKTVSVRNFGLTADEVARIRWNDAVLRENAVVVSSASKAEREQVAITNGYRVMLGRNALRLNEKLLQAARKHSKEMSDKGYFGHESPTPGLENPMLRMKAEGYASPAGENCAMGRSDPLSAHEGWLKSSGHHRNILMDSHTEMGSGQSGHLWTQNFGAAAITRRKN